MWGGRSGPGARFRVATWAAATFGAGFPLGTLIVNVAGSFLISAILETSLRSAAISATGRLFLTTGIMGCLGAGMLGLARMLLQVTTSAAGR